ncbi:hypothetical protein [Aliikangiella sp. G2MR2-5]|uniref:acyltransferase n=1 Tax=Aliikangiella sp. G2MR2-5 TaxID=2788943 RepID=UPI0018AA1D76|nr:hypothetical protein [Aliikangiella sp. G2MR2-5]
MSNLYLHRCRQELARRGSKNIQGQNNLIVSNQVDLTNVEFNVFGENNTIIIHPGVQFTKSSFNIYGNNHRIIIGENCQFNGPSNFWAEDEHCMISIGPESSFEGVHLSATEPGSNLVIGKNCMFSYDIDVRTGDSHSLISRQTNARYNYASDISFGDCVWVASHCIFTKGARLPSYSAVASGSLVNKKFEESHVIIAGRPATVVRKGVDWKRERIYTNTNASTPVLLQEQPVIAQEKRVSK